MINIVLCGGNGTRLWPISRKLYPKQFCKLIDEYSLYQHTLRRNNRFCEKSIIVTNNEQYFLALKQLKEININNYKFILEAVGKNTAPAITLACLSLNYEDIVLVTPSDHFIEDVEDYRTLLKQGNDLAEKGYMVTFGIKPNYPETEYGYIQAQGNDVVSFKEKPDIDTAKEYLKKGNFYWNSGIFIFKVGVYLEELKKYALDIFIESKNAYLKAIDEKSLRIKLEDMINMREDSIDYCVMEKSTKVKVIPFNVKWSDLGSFEALYKNLTKDRYGNSSSEKNININSNNNLILSNDRIIATIDIENLIVVDTPDAILISKKGSSHKVKEIVKNLEKTNKNIISNHLTAYRPWGTYTVLEEGYRYKIKKIVVKSGEKLSLQKHYHRNEHWTVVNGTAKIIVGDNEFILKENESTYIPIAEIHRLENPGKIDLVIIEIQVGDYLEEDDIVRIMDNYERI